MSTYAIGDIQGCFLTLQRLLDRSASIRNDRLWSVGIWSIAGHARWRCCVGAPNERRSHRRLGRHDLHLVPSHRRRSAQTPRYLGAGTASTRPRGTPDWLRHLRFSPKKLRDGTWRLVPEWSLEAVLLAQEAEAALRGPQGVELWLDLFRPPPLGGTLRIGSTASHLFIPLTRIRIYAAMGRYAWISKVHPSRPLWDLPWYTLMKRCRDPRLWTLGVLGLRLGGKMPALDSGCVWAEV
jgi:bis(5'-nucleosyl)-tetraphosphatase (symmetrical)